MTSEPQHWSRVKRIFKSALDAPAPERDAIVRHNVRFNAEADSLNFSMLGPDAAPDSDSDADGSIY